MKKFYRGVVYCIGLLILALGIILNTKAGLGISPIMTIPYCISIVDGINLGNATLYVYIIYVVGQIILRRKKFRAMDLLQIPMSIIFSQAINIFNNTININCNSLVFDVLVLIGGIILTGIGAAISVGMNIVPNAADGFAQAIGEQTGKGFGFGKNLLDICCVLITIIISIVLTGKIIGIGIGTLAAVLGIGRSIALTNAVFEEKMLEVAG